MTVCSSLVFHFNKHLGMYARVSRQKGCLCSSKVVIGIAAYNLKFN